MAEKRNRPLSPQDELTVTASPPPAGRPWSPEAAMEPVAPLAPPPAPPSAHRLQQVAVTPPPPDLADSTSWAGIAISLVVGLALIAIVVFLLVTRH